MSAEGPFCPACQQAPGYCTCPVPGGGRVLDELHAALTRYAAFPSPEAADAVTLWIAATHAQPAWEHATRLAVLSPEKRCGKSRLLDLIEATCHAPLITVNISAAALARAVGDDPPTLLLDEADTVFGKGIKGDEKAEMLRGLINAGHQRNRPYIRWDITTRALENSPTFAMAALAAIGDLPDTIMDRAVVIRMRRRAPGEHVAPFRIRRDTPALHVLRAWLTEWAQPCLEELSEAEPDTGLDDRAHDCWEPLCTIADLAGGTWPGRARQAAKALTEDATASETADGALLLADLARVFGTAEVMATKAILAALHAIEESPWNDIFGKQLDARGLATRLAPYDVRSQTVRLGELTCRGYRRADLWESWTRYLTEEQFHHVHHIRNSPASDVADVMDVMDNPRTGGEQ